MRAAATLVMIAAIAGCGRIGFEHGSLDGDPSDASTDGATGDASAPSSDGAAATPFAFRKPISIAAAQNRAGVDLTDIVIAVRITDPDLRLTGSGGRLVTGVDVAFVAADGVTPLAFDLDAISLATGDLLAWVRLPVLSATTATTFFLLFGNAAVTTAPANRVATWSGYRAAWHFSEAAYAGNPGESADATGAHHGRATGGATTTASGKLGRAVTLPGNCSSISVGASTALQPTSITVSAWIQPSDIGTGGDRIATIVAQDAWRPVGSGSQGYYLEVFRTVSQPEPTFYAANGPSLAFARATGMMVTNGTWYHVAGTYDEAAGTSRIYVNGALVGTANMSGAIDYLAKPVQIGCGPDGWWRGQLDEVRIFPFAMSPGQIATEYANQVAPPAFMTIGQSEPIP